MAVKEFRQGLRARIFVAVFIAVQLFAVATLAIEASAPAGTFDSPQADYIWLAGFFDNPPPFWILCETVFFVVLPVTGFTALQSEVSAANIELLLLTTLSRWRVVIGKWTLLTAQSSLVFISLLPYLAVRYFLGGIEILQTAFLALCTLGVNAVLNALIVGASAYKNCMLRLWMIAYQLLSAAFTAAIAVASVFYMLGQAFGLEPTTSPVVYNALTGILTAATAGLYIGFGLQLGRGRIRLFERAFETPESGVVSVLLFTAPIFVGMVTVITVGFGTLPALLVLGWSVLKLDSNGSGWMSASNPGDLAS